PTPPRTLSRYLPPSASSSPITHKTPSTRAKVPCPVDNTLPPIATVTSRTRAHSRIKKESTLSFSQTLSPRALPHHQQAHDARPTPLSMQHQPHHAQGPPPQQLPHQRPSSVVHQQQQPPAPQQQQQHSGAYQPAHNLPQQYTQNGTGQVAQHPQDVPYYTHASPYSTPSATGTYTSAGEFARDPTAPPAQQQQQQRLTSAARAIA
ncbi:hypothetical protein O988_09614, partial [Pseudogymnoascus sp. VKM F-3808]